MPLLVCVVIIFTCYLFLTTKRNESKEVANTLGCLETCFTIFLMLVGVVVLAFVVIAMTQ